VSTIHLRARSIGRTAPLLFPLAIALVFIVAPWDVESKLFLLLSGVCAQRPGHSFFVDGAPLPLEARMLGIFGGLAVAVAAAWLAGGWRRSGLPHGLGAISVVVGIGALGLDGVNALFYDSGMPHVYVPTNELRLATGLMCGIALAALIAPVVSWAFWRRRDPSPLFASWGDLGRTTICIAVLAVLIVSGTPGRLALSGVALLTAAGSFWLVNTYLAVILWQGAGAAEDWNDLAWSGAVGFLLTAGELAALAAVRGWAESSFGVAYSF
jgi:uncharacterized membrane protein